MGVGWFGGLPAVTMVSPLNSFHCKEGFKIHRVEG